MLIQDVNKKGDFPDTPLPESMATYGALSLLAAHCPLHKSYSAELLNRLFLPAIEHKSVRIFRTSNNQPCAALIWARLSQRVSSRMFTDHRPPRAKEWNSGEHLWFLDIIAPFGHGKDIARNLVRNPPSEAFSFARIGTDRKIRKLVEVKSGGRTNRAFRSSFIDPPGLDRA
ncbi:MAG: toxin-activating lysine-acyltransferase [Roseobacter sp.]|uniref:toxin-activating lysine-acyltransferase n=2 Tax=Tateyamaria sp. TaxID=1929288 RepID=UPI0032A118BB